MKRRKLKRLRLEARVITGTGRPCTNCGLETEARGWEGMPIRINTNTKGYYRKWYICRNKECPTTVQMDPEDYILYPTPLTNS